MLPFATFRSGRSALEAVLLGDLHLRYYEPPRPRRSSDHLTTSSWSLGRGIKSDRVPEKPVFIGDGGYYSAGQFYPEPADDVTVVAKWCFAHNAITSHVVRYTTTIPSSLHPYLSKSATLTKGGRVLALAVNGNYSSGVGNNGGVIAMVGEVNARGHEHFADVSGNEG